MRMPDAETQIVATFPDEEGAAFGEAISRIRAVVGPEHVLSKEAELIRNSACTTPWIRKCSAVVYPGCCEEVQRIVEIASKFKIQLWPFSTGKNWGYGTRNACQDGAVVLMLERLNKIIEVNEELAYAVIEPGVTYRQLNQYLKDHKIKLWSDCTDGPPDGSVLGNALERGLGETPYGDHFGNICGMEVVLPNGSMVRTGGGHFKNSRTWNTHKWGSGPYLEGLFTQSNMGIVTKAGIWLMPEPEDFNSYVFELGDEKDLPNVMDAVRRLALRDVIKSKIHITNDYVTLAVVLDQYPTEMLNGRPCLSADALSLLRQKYKVSPWSFCGAIYGSTAQIRADRSLMKKELSRYGTLTFFSDKKISRINSLIEFVNGFKATSAIGQACRSLFGSLVGKPPELIKSFPHVHSILKGIPSEFFVRHAYFRTGQKKPASGIDPARDRCGLIWFAPIVPLTGHDVRDILNMAKPLFEKHGFDFYVAMLLQNPRSVIPLMSVFYDKDDAAETNRANALYEDLCRESTNLGIQQYRAGTGYMDRLLDAAPEFKALAIAIKSSLDPFNILAPGRYGISSPAKPSSADLR